MERVILTTGGTGGHIFPALAVAEEIRSRYPRAMILFMGGKYGQEADLAVNAGLDFVGLPVRGVMGRGLKGVGAAFGMLRGVAGALRVMAKVKPQVVVGFGGYAAFAGVLAGRLSGVKTAIHEQNAFPGMTNRLLGKKVNTIFLSLPDASGVFPARKAVLVGNPVRASVVALYEEAQARLADAAAAAEGRGPTRGYYGGVDAPSPFDRDKAKKPAPEPTAETYASRRPRLLVMGGSLGAKAINDGMLAAISALLEGGVEIWHQTGQADSERVRAAYRAAGAGAVRVEPFIADVAKAFAWTDLILCRAGASSIAEITAAGLPALLVPFPQAAQDHQRHNARFLEQAGGGAVLEQEEFLREPGVLTAKLLELLRDEPRLRAMAAASLAVARPYAARDLVDGLEALLSK